jgi:lysophospholipase L1-like esterase
MALDFGPTTPAFEKAKNVTVLALATIFLYLQSPNIAISAPVPESDSTNSEVISQSYNFHLLKAAPISSSFPQKYLHSMHQLKDFALAKQNHNLVDFINQKIDFFSLHPEKITKFQFWELQRIYLQLFSSENPSIVWGDSRTQYNHLLNQEFVNFGISSTTSKDFVNELDYIKPENLRHVLHHDVFFGINDVKTGANLENIIKNYEMAIIKIISANPKTKIVIHSVVPPNFEIKPQNQGQKDLRLAMLKVDKNKIKFLNQKLKMLALKYHQNVVFSNQVETDLTQSMQNHEPVNTDTVHYTELGYQKVLQVLEHE